MTTAARRRARRARLEAKIKAEAAAREGVSADAIAEEQGRVAKARANEARAAAAAVKAAEREAERQKEVEERKKVAAEARRVREAEEAERRERAREERAAAAAAKAAETRGRAVVEGEGEGEGEGEEDEDEWITPANLEARVQAGTLGDALMGGDSTEQGEVLSVGVACVTTDFSMQNVLLSMGLGLTSPDGRQIRRVRRWAQRCHACFTIVLEGGAQFCPKCGNATLVRAKLLVAKNGKVKVAKTRVPTTRGGRYTVAAPTGGRRTKGYVVTTEDEYLALTGGFDRFRGGKASTSKQSAAVRGDAELLGSRKLGGATIGGPNGTTDYQVGAPRNPNRVRRKIGKKNKPF